MIKPFMSRLPLGASLNSPVHYYREWRLMRARSWVGHRRAMRVYGRRVALVQCSRTCPRETVQRNLG